MDISDLAGKIVNIDHVCNCIVSNVNFNKGEFVQTKFADDGMDVWITLSRSNNNICDLIQCRIVCAAGYHVRVMNKSHRIDKWREIGGLYVPSQNIVSKIMDE